MLMMDQPIKKAMNKPEAVGKPRTAIKAHALADFIVEFTLPDVEKAQDESKRRMILTDGSSV